MISVRRPRSSFGWRRWLHRLGADDRAISAVEFALMLPVLLLFLAGATEMAWYIGAHYKATRAAKVLADLTARVERISSADVTDIFAATSHVLAPLDVNGDGRTFISSVDNSGSGARITWQRRSASGINVSSLIGTAGAVPNAGSGITVNNGEALIVAEVFLDYTPLLGLINIDFGQIYARSAERPRYGSVQFDP